MKYIVEHLEDEMYEWCIKEYKHIAETVGRNNILFTNVPLKDKDKIYFADSTSESAVDMEFEKPCLLDPKGENILDKDDDFDVLIFGGILGDYPPRERTQEMKLECTRRNLGDRQMSTNTAVYVAKKIIDGMKFQDFVFVEELVIPTSENEEVILPFRYVVEKGKIVVPEGYIDMIKKSGF